MSFEEPTATGDISLAMRHVPVRTNTIPVRWCTTPFHPSCSFLSGPWVSWSLDKKSKAHSLHPIVLQISLVWIFSSGDLQNTLFSVEKCKMWMSCMTTVRAAECVTNEMLVSTCPETEYRLNVCCPIDSAHIDVYWAHKGIWDAQCLKMYQFLQYTFTVMFITVRGRSRCIILRTTPKPLSGLPTEVLCTYLQRVLYALRI
jgi:hypothetical protein